MEALSCCVLQVQTKAAQAVFSSTVWSFIPPLLPELQAYLTNFQSFCKEGSRTDKVLLFDRFQTLFKRQSFDTAKSNTVSVHCFHWTAAQAGLAAPNTSRTLSSRISELEHMHGNPVERVLYSKLNFTPVSWALCWKYPFWKWETKALCYRKGQNKKAFCPSWNYPLVWRERYLEVWPLWNGFNLESEFLFTQEKKARGRRWKWVQHWRRGKSTAASNHLWATAARRINLPQLNVFVCNCSFTQLDH